MIYILLAVINGTLIALARSLNGRLGVSRGAFFSSWINHIGGFLFLTLMLLATRGYTDAIATVPVYTFLGGIIGALYVGLGSYVVPRIGVTQATLLVIAGQLAISVMIDVWFGKITLAFDFKSLQLFAGSVLLVIGFYASVASSEKPKQEAE